MKLTSLVVTAVAITPLVSLTAAAEDGMIQVASGRCLDVHAPDLRQNGGRVQVWSCHGQPQQIWRYDSWTRTIRSEGGLCLDTHAPDMAVNGGRVQVWTCNGSAQQRWTYTQSSGRVQLSSGLCLDAHAPEQLSDGGRVQVWSCNSQPQQTWLFTSTVAQAKKRQAVWNYIRKNKLEDKVKK